MKMRIATITQAATLTREAGTVTYAARTEEDLDEKVADFCREQSSGMFVVEQCKPRTYIDHYFDSQDHDTITYSQVEVDVGTLTFSEADLEKAVIRREFASSLERAIKQAGGSLRWEEARRMSLDELCDFAASNGVRFDYIGKEVIAQNTNRANAAVALVHPALAFLK